MNKRTFYPGIVSGAALLIAGFVYYYAIAGFVLPTRGFVAGDQFFKLLTVKSLVRDGTTAIVAGPTIDPEQLLTPLQVEKRFFMFRQGGAYYSQYSLLFAALTAPFYAVFGYYGVWVLPALGGSITALVSALLISRIFPKIPYFGAYFFSLFLSGLQFYSLTFWEHTPAVALAFAGLGMYFLTARDAPMPRRLYLEVLAGFSIGMGTFFREESIFVFGGVLIAIFICVPRKAIVNWAKWFVTGFLIAMGVRFLAGTLIVGDPFLGRPNIIYGIYGQSAISWQLSVLKMALPPRMPYGSWMFWGWLGLGVIVVVIKLLENRYPWERGWWLVVLWIGAAFLTTATAGQFVELPSSLIGSTPPVFTLAYFFSGETLLAEWRRMPQNGRMLTLISGVCIIAPAFIIPHWGAIGIGSRYALSGYMLLLISAAHVLIAVWERPPTYLKRWLQISLVVLFCANIFMIGKSLAWLAQQKSNTLSDLPTMFVPGDVVVSSNWTHFVTEGYVDSEFLLVRDEDEVQTAIDLICQSPKRAFFLIDGESEEHNLSQLFERMPVVRSDTDVAGVYHYVVRCDVGEE